jgi:hypothetical protein
VCGIDAEAGVMTIMWNECPSEMGSLG